MRDELVRGAVAEARRMFEFGAEQVYVAVEGEIFYVTDDPLDRHVVAAARSTREVERAGEELVHRLRALSPRTS